MTSNPRISNSPDAAMLAASVIGITRLLGSHSPANSNNRGKTWGLAVYVVPW